MTNTPPHCDMCIQDVTRLASLDQQQQPTCCTALRCIQHALVTDTWDHRSSVAAQKARNFSLFSAAGTPTARTWLGGRPTRRARGLVGKEPDLTAFWRQKARASSLSSILSTLLTAAIVLLTSVGGAELFCNHWTGEERWDETPQHLRQTHNSLTPRAFVRRSHNPCQHPSRTGPCCPKCHARVPRGFLRHQRVGGHVDRYRHQPSNAGDDGGGHLVLPPPSGPCWVW